jgi:hypothetical protein
MEKDKIKYILNYFSSLMTKEEQVAWRHWSTTYKMEHSESTFDQKDSRKKLSIERGLMTDDKHILVLLEDGIDDFERRVAERINTENSINFNDCPNCGKLARTPKAKQCRFCVYDWH